jgi:prepilin-type N-terminal cleavage/methylation domain-containing protein
LTADPSVPTDVRDGGFTLLETVIVVLIMGILMPVLAFSFSVVVRNTPTAEDRADDARSLLNLTTSLSQDVSSTREDGFFIGTSAPGGGCLASSLPASSINLLELHWSEGTENYVTNYRWITTGPSVGQIYRYACQQGQVATAARMTPDLNEVASGTGMFAPAPVEITRALTTKADGSPGTKGLQFVVLIFDDFGIQRELLSLDATTTNVLTTLPGGSGASGGSNTAPIASDLSMTITPPATQVETLQATDPDGDVLFTTFPNGLPGAWNILATGVTLQVTPDPAAVPGPYEIIYRVTDPYGASADAKLLVTIAAPTLNQPPIAKATSISASRGVPAAATLDFSDPEGDVLVSALDPTTIPSGWTATLVGKEFTVTPSATASGTAVIRYSVTDSALNTTTSQITVNVCTVELVSFSPTTVAVKNNGDLFDAVTIEIRSNGACAPLVVGFLPNTDSAVEATVNFNATNVATIPKNSAFAWLRPPVDGTRVVPLNVRQGANGPIELSVNLTTTR